MNDDKDSISEGFVISGVAESELRHIYRDNEYVIHENQTIRSFDQRGYQIYANNPYRVLSRISPSEFVGPYKKLIQLDQLVQRLRYDERCIPEVVSIIQYALSHWEQRMWDLLFHLISKIDLYPSSEYKHTYPVKQYYTIVYLLRLMASDLVSVDNIEMWHLTSKLDPSFYDHPLSLLEEGDYRSQDWNVLLDLQSRNTKEGSVFRKRPWVRLLLCEYLVSKDGMRFEMLVRNHGQTIRLIDNENEMEEKVNEKDPVFHVLTDDHEILDAMTAWSGSFMEKAILSSKRHAWINHDLYLKCRSKKRMDLCKLLAPFLLKNILNEREVKARYHILKELFLSDWNVDRDPMLDQWIQNDIDKASADIWTLGTMTTIKDKNKRDLQLSMIVMCYVRLYHQATYAPHIKTVLGAKWNQWSNKTLRLVAFLCGFIVDSSNATSDPVWKNKEEWMTWIRQTIWSDGTLSNAFVRLHRETHVMDSILTSLSRFTYSAVEWGDVSYLFLKGPYRNIKAFVERIDKKEHERIWNTPTVQRRYNEWIEGKLQVAIDDPVIFHYFASAFREEHDDMFNMLFYTPESYEHHALLNRLIQSPIGKQALDLHGFVTRLFEGFENDPDSFSSSRSYFNQVLERLSVLAEWAKEKKVGFRLKELDGLFSQPSRKGELCRLFIHRYFPMMIQASTKHFVTFFLNHPVEAVRLLHKTSPSPKQELIHACVSDAISLYRRDHLQLLANVFPEEFLDAVIVKGVYYYNVEAAVEVLNWFPKLKLSESLQTSILGKLVEMKPVKDSDRRSDMYRQFLKRIDNVVGIDGRKQHLIILVERSILHSEPIWIEWIMNHEGFVDSLSKSEIQYLLHVTSLILRTHYRRRLDLLRAIWLTNLGFIAKVWDPSSRSPLIKEIMKSLKASGTLWSEIQTKWFNRSSTDRKRYVNADLDHLSVLDPASQNKQKKTKEDKFSSRK